MTNKANLLFVSTALFLLSMAISAEVWMPLGNGGFANQQGQVAMPLDQERRTYLMPDNSVLMIEKDMAISSTGTVYFGGNGFYSGSDGSAGYIDGGGDVFEFREKNHGENEVDLP